MRREIIRFIRVSWQGDPLMNFPVTTDTAPFSSVNNDVSTKVGHASDDLELRYVPFQQQFIAMV